MRPVSVFRGARGLATTLILFASVIGLAAQSVTDPITAEFDPSPDHSALAADGTPIVQSYKLALYVVGTTTPFETVSLGKPAIATDGKIRVNFLPLLTALPAPGVAYEARVSAVGPGGTASSAVSNSFLFSGTCSSSITPTAQSFTATGGTGTVSMTIPAGCTWTAVSNAAWITITSGASGSGSGTIAFTVAANPTTASRTGTITAGGRTFTVTQAASASCTYALGSSGQSVAATGGTGSVTMTAGTGCAWTATSSAAWITITSGASGSGAGTIAFTVAANPTTSSRTGTITAGGKTFTVTQAAASCTYALGSTGLSFGAAGGPNSVTMTTLAGCTWTAASSAAWITITSGASGSGSGTIAFTVAANPTTSLRTGTITAGGQTFTVTQAAASCTYALGSTALSVAPAGGLGSVTVTTSAGCTWTAASNAAWITITSGASGSGSGTIAFSVAANPTTSSRTGTITAGGQTFTVTQAASSCTLTLGSTGLSVAAAGGTGSVTMTTATGCTWTAVSSAAWITITSGASGSGPGTIAFTVAANSTTSSRTGTITAGGQTFTVTQAAPSCTFAIGSTGQSFPVGGGTGSIAMTTTTGCGWTAVSNAAWVTVTSGASGSGSGTIAFAVAANSTTSSRTATITAGGQTFTVTQSTSTCTYTLGSTGQSVPVGGGSGIFSMTTGVSCAWTAVSNAAWITVTVGASGTGAATIAFTVAANPGTSRTGTITAGGQTFTVTQAGGSCTYTLGSTGQSLPAGGGSGIVSMTAGVGCAWTAVSNAAWITITTGASGSGSGTIAFTVAANPTTTSRTGTITAGGQTYTVTQTTSSCTLALGSTGQSFVAGGGSGIVSMTAGVGCTWTAVSNATWITITAGASGSGSGTIAFTVAANSSLSSRTGTVTAGGQTFTVTQAGGSCSYALGTTGQSVPTGGGSGMISMTAGFGCSWTAVSGASWITITAGQTGSGAGTITFTVAANSSESSRTGTITAGGQTFTVSQAGGSCTYAFTPTSQTVPAAGGTGSIAVTAPAGCTWAASSGVAWITIMAGKTGSGGGTITFTVAANPGTTTRAGTIFAAGKTLFVTQSAGSALAPVTGLRIVSGGGNE